MPIDVANYDRSGYDYKSYWKTRQYENLCEHLALKRMLPVKGKDLIDLGGGYGRLADLYVDRFTRCVLYDLSKQQLAQGPSYPNLKKVHGDLYDLPFASSSFEVGLMIRVIHHLHEPLVALREAHRILRPQGHLILEFANKTHIKAYLEGLRHFDLASVRDLKPTRLSSAGIFYNYHPQHVQQMLKETGFRTRTCLSVSNLRLALLKKTLPLSVLMLLEEWLQVLFAPFKFGPSIFVCAEKV